MNFRYQIWWKSVFGNTFSYPVSHLYSLGSSSTAAISSAKSYNASFLNLATSFNLQDLNFVSFLTLLTLLLFDPVLIRLVDCRLADSAGRVGGGALTQCVTELNETYINLTSFSFRQRRVAEPELQSWKLADYRYFSSDTLGKDNTCTFILYTTYIPKVFKYYLLWPQFEAKK